MGKRERSPHSNPFSILFCVLSESEISSSKITFPSTLKKFLVK